MDKDSLYATYDDNYIDDDRVIAKWDPKIKSKEK